MPFRKTKADEFAAGVTSCMPIKAGILNPVEYMDDLNGLQPGDKICRWSKPALLSRLRSRLAGIGVENTAIYSWRSFRRGAAHFFDWPGGQDCVIKKHGRWNSEAYLPYVAVSAVRDGEEVFDALRLTK